MRSVARALLPRGVRNWLRSPGSSLAWLADELRYALAGGVRHEIRPGWSVTCHPAAWRSGYQLALADPAQEAELSGFLAACSPGMVLFDIGAHFGLFSLAALHAGGTQARAVAADPSPWACRMLRIQAALNAMTDRLAIVPEAVAAESGSARLVPVGVIAGGYYADADAVAADRRAVPATTLDDLVTRFGPPTHVKVDVEGFESEVLRGGRRLLGSDRRPILFVELHHEMARGRGRDPSEVLDILRDHGYSLGGPGGGPADRAELLSQPLVRIIARPEAAPSSR